MISPEQIVAAARTYIGVPFLHQGRSRLGVDCRGLVSCIAYDLGIADVRIDDYDRQPDERRFRTEVRRHLDSIQFAELRPGDMLTFWFGGERHFGVVSAIEPLTIVHADEGVGRVIETPVDQAMLLRVRGCWRYRGVA